MIPPSLTTSLRSAVPSVALLFAMASLVPRACSMPTATADALGSPVPTVAPEIVTCGGHRAPAACMATVSQPVATVRTTLAEALVMNSNLSAALDVSEAARAKAETKSGRLELLLKAAEAKITGLLDENAVLVDENVVLRDDTVKLYNIGIAAEADAAEKGAVADAAIEDLRVARRDDDIWDAAAKTTDLVCDQKRTVGYKNCEAAVHRAQERAAADDVDPMADLLDRARSLGAIEDGKRTVTYTAGSVSD